MEVNTGHVPGGAIFADPVTTSERLGDGSVILRSGIPLAPYAGSMAGLFRAAAAAHPDRVLVAQRDAGGWRKVTYAAARRQVDGLAQGLLDRCGTAARPVMILSGNSVEHLLLTLACYTAGLPAVPVSTAYSLLASDHSTLRAMADLVGPAVVFADDGDAYGAALRAAGGTGSGAGGGAGSGAGAGPAVVTLSGRAGHRGVTAFGELAGTAVTSRLAERADAVGPGTIAKILFTSGSTGRPKGVLTTHQMMCANQQMIRQAWPFLTHEPPVLLDWLPWSHTFGGSHNVNQVIANAGTLWIDDGRPAPGMIERTVRNLADVSPTVYYNVPAGYAALLPFLERDRDLAAAFFARLRLVFFAGAALPQRLWDAIGELAASVGSAAPMTTSWGATETAPAATSAHFASGRADCIGVPLPGVDVKLAPAGDRLEIRVRGPNVTPGYAGRPDLTEAAFDADGFYRTGDAVALVDSGDPNAGLRFDGRIAEDFKLATGTWVRVAALRTALLSAGGGLLQDAVLAGRDAGFIGALCWLSPQRAAQVAGAGDGASAGPAAVAAGPAAVAASPAAVAASPAAVAAGPAALAADPAALAADPAVRAEAARALDRYNAGRTGTSQQIRRLILLAEPPSLADGEITDKNYVNQRAVLRRRAGLVAALYAADPPPEVICWPGEPSAK
jgi:feruloyl-CoA synthase